MMIETFDRGPYRTVSEGPEGAEGLFLDPILIRRAEAAERAAKALTEAVVITNLGRIEYIDRTVGLLINYAATIRDAARTRALAERDKTP